MSHRRAHIVIPEDLAAEIDEVAGKRGVARTILITDNRKHYPMPDLRLFGESPRR